VDRVRERAAREHQAHGRRFAASRLATATTGPPSLPEYARVLHLVDEHAEIDVLEQLHAKRDAPAA
jgi:hypothetical protein